MLSFPIKTSTVDNNEACTNAIELVQTSILLSPLKLDVLKFKLTLIQITNLTSESNICEVAPMSFSWGANRLNKLPEIHFEFPFNLGSI